jgi:hypothetical protein
LRPFCQEKVSDICPICRIGPIRPIIIP